MYDILQLYIIKLLNDGLKVMTDKNKLLNFQLESNEKCKAIYMLMREME